MLESRYRALDLEPISAEDCYLAILELTSTIKEDQRVYQVIVENDRGSDRRVLMLRVTEPGQVRHCIIFPSVVQSDHQKFPTKQKCVQKLQIPLVIGAVAGFTVLSVLIMGLVCFLRYDRCCIARGPVPDLQQVRW